MATLRNELHVLGYALNYTAGVSRVASIYPWRKVGSPRRFEVDMSDSVVGWKKIQEIVDHLKEGRGMETKTIAGHEITLESGKWYRGSRPLADRIRKVFPISISDIEGNEVLKIDGLDYDAANEFLRAFNNGVTSFDGRIW